MKFTDRLTNKNPCPAAWECKGENGYPISEMGYLRCNNDGCQWWSTAWPLNRKLETPELISELDGVYESFRKAFRTMRTMTRWCREHAQPTSDPTEFHAWYEGKHGSYWLRIIGAVEILRDVNHMSDEEIIEEIKKRYQLNDYQARSFVYPKDSDAV